MPNPSVLLTDALSANLSDEEPIEAQAASCPLTPEDLHALNYAMHDRIIDTILLNYLNAQRPRSPQFRDDATLSEILEAIGLEIELVLDTFQATMKAYEEDRLSSDHLLVIVSAAIKDISGAVRTQIYENDRVAFEDLPTYISVPNVDDILWEVVFRVRDIREDVMLTE